jgi:hypothetical protein
MKTKKDDEEALLGGLGLGARGICRWWMDRQDRWHGTGIGRGNALVISSSLYNRGNGV